jgi:hypothetical protein
MKGEEGISPRDRISPKEEEQEADRYGRKDISL